METVASPSFAALLRRYRLAAGLTQEGLAERANLSVRAVSDLERGLRTAPRRDTVDLLAEALVLAPADCEALRAAVSRHRGPAAPPPTSSSLPAELTPLIGREQDEARAIHLLRWEGIRLLTLTGTGGVGKTQLALRVARSLAGDFADSAVFVPLASIGDPSLVPTSLATSLGIREQEGQSVEDLLVSQLHGQERLLVLDNFEHLLAAAPLLSRLLAACPRVTILVTSRAPLHLQLEQEMEVPPLAIPPPSSLPSPAHAIRSPAVVLFVQRARAVRPEFRLSHDNALTVAEICYRLDGLPLAIELAAARIKLFPPQALLQRLEQPLSLLTGGAADQPLRQQTLRNTIDWSYSLLTGAEQTLFARLSVFAGGCTFEAAEAVCDPEGDLDLLEALVSLVDKSLVRQEGEEARFGMLETIRQYAAEKLVLQGERELLRRRHAEYVDVLVKEADVQLGGSEQVRQLERLEREHDNLRAALQWSLDQGSELVIRIAANLWQFWEIRGYLTEGRHWLEAALTVPEHVGDAALRARALSGAGNLAWRQGNFERAKELHERALGLRRQLGDTVRIAGSLVNLGRVARRQGDFQRAQALFEESLELYRELGNTHGTALALNCLGLLMQQRGDFERAKALYDDSLQLMRELGHTQGMSIAIVNLADLAEQLGEYDKAKELYRESLRIGRELEDKTLIAESLIGLGAVAAHQQQHERALQLLGAGDSIATSIGVSLEPLDLERFQTVSRVAGTALSAEARESAWNQGAAMTMEEAIAYALDQDRVA